MKLCSQAGVWEQKNFTSRQRAKNKPRSFLLLIKSVPVNVLVD